jgi:bifunctional non-homologous end joining protein LigD
MRTRCRREYKRFRRPAPGAKKPTMGLDEYRRKRDFQKTPEPRGKVEKRAAGRRFIVQKHAASHLHYDFRLELEGVLKSWAVPKGPSRDPSLKRLAMQTEDHPLSYADFEGVIPKGQYGGGTVLLWDRGEWVPEEDPHEGIRKGRLRFRLEGEKLRGSYILTRTHGRAGNDRGRSWLLIKLEDAFASRHPDEDVTRDEASVATGRTMREIAADRDRVWQSDRAADKPAPDRAHGIDLRLAFRPTRRGGPVVLAGGPRAEGRYVSCRNQGPDQKPRSSRDPSSPIGARLRS